MNLFKQESKISAVLQLVSAFAIAAAIFGFLVVNMYLALFGFWDFNFLKVQYFSAGGLFLVFVILPALLFYAFFKAEEILEKYRNKNKKFFKSVFVFILKIFVLGALGFFSFFIFILPLSTGYESYSPGFLYVLGALWTVMIFGMVGTLRKSHREITQVRYQEINLKNINIYFGAYYRLLFTVAVLPMLVITFSFLVYPTLPRYFGGGRPAAITIGFDKNFESAPAGINNPFDAFLIYQSADSLLVLTDKGTYLLRQSDVAYIKYIEASARMRALQDLTNPPFSTSTAPAITIPTP